METWMIWIMILATGYLFMFAILAMICKGSEKRRLYDKELYDSIQRETEYQRRWDELTEKLKKDEKRN